MAATIENVAEEVIPSVATPETVTVTPVAETNVLTHMETKFNRPFTEADLGVILTHAESRNNPALDTLLDAVDSPETAVALAALENLYNWYALEAAQSQPKSSLSSRLLKASLNNTARQAPIPAAPVLSATQVTEAILADARKTGREPTATEVLAAHGISI